MSNESNTVASLLTDLDDARKDIISSINSKGGGVPETARFSELPSAIDDIHTVDVSDNGKVVVNGELVAQTAYPSTVTANGTIDTTTNNSVTVNVSNNGFKLLTTKCTPSTVKNNISPYWVTDGVPAQPYLPDSTISINGNMIWTDGDNIYIIRIGIMITHTFRFNMSSINLYPHGL